MSKPIDSGSAAIDPWLLERLACPRCHGALVARDGWLTCGSGHRYPIVDGTPVMLLDDVRQTHWAATASLEQAAQSNGRGESGSDSVRADERDSTEVDPVVMEAIGATGGNLYKHLIGCLPRYPIPRLELDAPADSTFLDLGCHWGRWCVAAARHGWRVVGLDPYLPAIGAAKRTARALGVNASFVVGDARYLPFASSTFEIVHSYSVLQHFSEVDVARCADDVGRVLVPGGFAHIQMAQKWGALNVVQQLRRGFRTPTQFEVRYWTGARLREVFSRAIGPATLVADGFLSLNAQAADLDLLRPTHRWIVRLSESLKSLSTVWPMWVDVADSVYVHSVKGASR